MTDERLKEIKDSIDLQLEVAKVIGLNHVLKEEKELYDYVEELRKKLKEKDEGFKAVNEELCEYAEENEKLKKQLEENKNSLKGIFAQVNDDMLLRNCGAMQSEIDKYKTQQQEFIKYMKDEISKYNESKKYATEYHESNLLIKKSNVILQKYKEIIGNDINVGSKGEK